MKLKNYFPKINDTVRAGVNSNQQLEKAILVGLVKPGESLDRMREHLDELALLTSTAGATVVEKVIQKRPKITPNFYIGTGKAEQIIQQAKELGVRLIIFDDDLSASQIKNYHNLAGNSIKVIDRTMLILDVFKKHARTREAQTQVELAHLQYLLPRLTRMWTHLERQMGGIGTRAGAGEAQIEVDRRMIRERISKLQKELEKIEIERETQSKHRKEAYRIALVGYTNAGKSTLMNALTNANVYVEDKLFATLDTTVRALDIKSKYKILVSDSVGFIRKLPHHLVASFRSTLKEIVEADLLLMILDASSPFGEEHYNTVREVLQSIDAHQKDFLLVMNKIDIIKDGEVLSSLKSQFPEAIFISARDHLRLDALEQAILAKIEASFVVETVTFDPTFGKQIASVYHEVEVLNTWVENNKIAMTIRGKRAKVDKVMTLSKDSRV